jgi:hypothetical protein
VLFVSFVGTVFLFGIGGVSPLAVKTSNQVHPVVDLAFTRIAMFSGRLPVRECRSRVVTSSSAQIVETHKTSFVVSEHLIYSRYVPFKVPLPQRRGLLRGGESSNEK